MDDSMNTANATQFVICVQNDDADDLELRKLYQNLPDDQAAADGYLRVIDESGEDYLYPASYFVRVMLPPGDVQLLDRLVAVGN